MMLFADIDEIIDAAQSGNDINVLTNWIPTGERLPKDGDSVLAWGCGFIEIGWYDADFKKWYTNDFCYEDGEVTHWMPLPEPPKECE